MAESFVQVPVDGAGKKLRSEQLVVGPNTVEQEVVTIASAAGNKLDVDAAGLGQIDIAAVSVPVPVTDNGGSLTVDGTVSVVEPVSVDDNGASLTVDNPTLSVVGGGAEATAIRVTLANDSTGVVSIDDNGGSITVDGTVTVAEPVSVDDNGGSLTVDGTVVVSSITTSVTPGTAAENLGKAEDAPHSSGDVGVMALAVRNDAGVAFAADGDYVPLSVDSAGAVRVSGVAGGTQYAEDTAHVSGDMVNLAGVVQQAADAALSGDGDRSLLQVDATGFLKVNVKAGGTGSTQYAEDTAHVSGDTLTLAGVVRQDADAPLSADGDRSLLQVDALGHLKVDIKSGTVTVAEPVSVDDNAGSLTVDNPTLSVVGGGTEATALRVTIANDSTGVLSIDDNGGSITVDGTVTVTEPVSVDDNGGSLTVDGTVAVTQVTPGTGATDLGKAEDAAHTTGDVGVMSLAVRNDAGTALAADGDYIPLSTNSSGALRVTGGTAGTEFAEDTAHVTGALGTLALAVRNDAAAALTTTDGDYSALATDSAGRIGISDLGGSITVDGTVTVTEPVSVDDNGASLTVDNPTLSVVGGGTEATALRVTVANDSTGVLSIDDNGGSITVDGTVTVTEPVSVDDNGGSLTVDGTVAVSSVIPGTGPTNLGKIEDDPHASGDVGVMMLAVRNDSNIALASTDLDYIPLAADSAGNLQVTVAGGVFQYAEDSAHVDGDGLTLAGVVQQAADAALSGDGDRSLMQVDATGWLKTAVKQSVLPAGAATLVEQQTQTASLSILDDWDESDRAKVNPIAGQAGVQGGSGAVTALTQRVVLATDVALPAGTNNIGDVDILSIVPGTGPTNLGKAEDSAHASTDVGVMALVTANEANTVRAADNDYVPIAADTEGNVRMVGNRDHDAADAGEPVKIGGVAVSGSATPTSVASGDRTRFLANQHGIPYHIAGHPNLITREYDFGASAQTNVNLAAAAVAADERIYVTRFEAFNDIATTAAGVSVRAGFGTAAVPTASATGVSGMIGSHPGLAPGSGIMCGTGAGIIAVGAAGEEPYFTCSAATAGNVHVIISYFLIDETP